MSWDYTKHKARCSKCGQEGFCVEGSDDWGRSSTEWIGFDSKDPDSTSIARKRLDARDRLPICKCGSQEVVVER